MTRQPIIISSLLVCLVAFQAAHGQLCSESRLAKIPRCIANVVYLGLGITHDRQATILRHMHQRCRDARLVEQLCGDCAPPLVEDYEKALCHGGELTKPAVDVYRCLSYLDSDRLSKEVARGECETSADCPFCLYETMIKHCRIPKHFKAYWTSRMGAYEARQISDRIFGVCKAAALDSSMSGLPAVPDTPVNPLPMASTARPDPTTPRDPNQPLCHLVSREANLQCLHESMIRRNRSDVVDIASYAGPWAMEKMFTQWCRAKMDLHEDCPCAGGVLKFLEVICDGESLNKPAHSVLECHQSYTPLINKTIQTECPEALQHKEAINCSQALDDMSCVWGVHEEFCGQRVANLLMDLFKKAIELHTRFPVYPDFTSMCTITEFNERFGLKDEGNNKMMSYIFIAGGVIYCIGLCLLGVIFALCLCQNSGNSERTRRPSSDSPQED